MARWRRIGAHNPLEEQLHTMADPWNEILGGDCSDDASDFASDKIAAGDTDPEMSDGAETDADNDGASAGPAGPVEPVEPVGPVGPTIPAAKPAKTSKAPKPMPKAVKTAKSSEPGAEKTKKASRKRKNDDGKAPKAKPAGVGPATPASLDAGEPTASPKKAQPKKRVKTTETAPTLPTKPNAIVVAAKLPSAAPTPSAVEGVQTAPSAAAAPSNDRDVFVIAMDVVGGGYIRIQGPFPRCVSRIRALVGNDSKKNLVFVRNFQMYVPRDSPRFSRLVGASDDAQRTIYSFSIDEGTRGAPTLDSIFKFAEPDPL